MELSAEVVLMAFEHVVFVFFTSGCDGVVVRMLTVDVGWF